MPTINLLSIIFPTINKTYQGHRKLARGQRKRIMLVAEMQLFPTAQESSFDIDCDTAAQCLISHPPLLPATHPWLLLCKRTRVLWSTHSLISEATASAFLLWARCLLNSAKLIRLLVEQMVPTSSKAGISSTR